jgi:hypothetical protein
VQIGYGTLLGNRWTSPSKGFQFSSKLSRAEALALFRKRFQVPLEWEELVTDPAAQPSEAGRPMTRSALHHLLWVVRGSGWRSVVLHLPTPTPRFPFPLPLCCQPPPPDPHIFRPPSMYQSVMHVHLWVCGEAFTDPCREDQGR